MPSFSLEVEYAKSGRAACRQCKEKIEKDAVRVGLKTAGPEDADFEMVKWYHFGCLPRVRGAPWFKKNFVEDASEAIANFSSLTAADQKAVKKLWAACRGEGEAPAAPLTAAAKAAAKEEAKGSKRKKKGDDAKAAPAAKAAKVLTNDETKAMEKARKEFEGKTVAALGALLAKNGLPKAGRREELLERCAENKALGVPPVCPLCEKAKLQFSMGTGQFRCPGFFDSDAGHFKRCKGPGEECGELKRTAWQELI